MSSIIIRIVKKIGKILNQPLTPQSPLVVAQAAVLRLEYDDKRVEHAEALLLRLIAERAEAARLNASALEEAIKSTNSQLQNAETALRQEIARQEGLRDQEIARLQAAIAAVRDASVRKQNQLAAHHTDFRLAKQGEIEEAAEVLARVQHAALLDD